MVPGIEFSYEKNLILKATRGVCFDDVIEAIERDQIIDDLKHPRKDKYPNQRILVVKIKNYIYAVPYILKDDKKTIFLKTVYPSRVLTGKYFQKGKNKHEKKK